MDGTDGRYQWQHSTYCLTPQSEYAVGYVFHFTL